MSVPLKNRLPFRVELADYRRSSRAGHLRHAEVLASNKGAESLNDGRAIIRHEAGNGEHALLHVNDKESSHRQGDYSTVDLFERRQRLVWPFGP